MSIEVALHHRTDYRYDRPIALGPQIVRLRPAPHCRTPILAYSLKVEPDAALPQLAAGPAGQLPRARSSSRRRPTDFDVEVDLVADMTVINPFDFFLEPAAETLSLRLRPGARAASSRRSARPQPAGPAARGAISPSVDRAAAPHDRLPGRAQPQAAAATSATSSAWSPASRRREETLARGAGLVPRHRLAAGADPAPSRLRRALRLGLPDPARRRREAARRSGRARPPTSPTCTPGARSICPAPAGSGSTRPPACSPAKATSRSPARPSRRAPRRSPARSSSARSSSASRHDGDARRARRRASPSPTPTSSGPHRWRSAQRVDRDLADAGRAPHHGRRADLRRRSTIRDGAGVEHRRRSARPSARYAGELLRRLADRFAPRRAAALRPGQMVSRRAAAALGARLLLAHGRRADLARPGAVRRRRRRDYGARPRATSQRFVDPRSPSGCSSIPTACVAGLRGRLVLPLARAPAAGQRRSARRASSRTRRSARASRASSSRACDTSVGYALPLRRAGLGGARRWQSGRGSSAPETMFLLPGDSPMGFRLPLDSLPWVGDERLSLRHRRRTRSRRARRCRRARPSPAPRAAAPRRRRRALPARQRREQVPLRRRRRAEPRCRASCAPRSASSRATGCSTSSCRRSRPSRTISTSSPRSRTTAAELRTAGRHRRLPAAVRSAPAAFLGHARSRRHRGQHPSGRELGRARRATPTIALRGGARTPARHREVHARRPPHRHRRRQPRHPRRRHAGRQPVPAPARSAARACSATGTTTRRSRISSPACSSARPARLRASTRRATTRSTSSRSPSARSPDAATTRRPGWSTACSATCSSTSPATRTAPSSASTSSTRPTAPPAGSASSSCAPSRCRRTRA